MKISKNYDVTKGAPSFEKGTNPFDNAGIKPNSSIPDTAGQKASNPAAAHSVSKAQPAGKGGSGYTG